MAGSICCNPALPDPPATPPKPRPVAGEHSWQELGNSMEQSPLVLLSNRHTRVGGGASCFLVQDA